MALDRNWRKSRRKEEKGRRRSTQIEEIKPVITFGMAEEATKKPALMEGVERTNAVVVRGLEVGVEQNMGVPPRWDPYAMEVDRGRNCYACGGFVHMAHYCRNWR